jgi:hypothetical protein
MAGYKSVVFDPSAMQTEINSASSMAIVNASAASDAASAAAAAAAAASDAASKASVAAASASDAASKAGVASAAVSDAASKASVALAAASDAGSKIASKSSTWDKASAASSALAVLDASVVKSIPGSGSFVVKEVVYTAASEIKFRMSSVAAG